MKKNIVKIIIMLILVALAITLMLGCNKKPVIVTPKPDPPEMVTLTYIAGEGGRIEGETKQTLEKHADGKTVTQ